MRRGLEASPNAHGRQRLGDLHNTRPHGGAVYPGLVVCLGGAVSAQIHPTSITDRQKELLTFLRAFHVEHGLMPTLGQMADHLGASSRTTPWALLNGLEKRGRIKRQHQKWYAIEIIDGPWEIPDTIEAELQAFCRKTERRPGSVIGDALLIYLRHPSRRKDDIQ